MRQNQERRTDNRLLCAELVEAIWTDHRGVQRRRVANLEDISLSGVCLQVESAVLPGTRIAVNYGDGQLIGTVRYCMFRDGGHFLGIQLEDGCRWSTKHFRPQHLVDPGRLVELALARHQKTPSISTINEPALSK
ncbi:MAG TPA: hypothetical protein VH601_20205 [Bryobacteraceae bacterium]|jgi:hypothetical protein